MSSLKQALFRAEEQLRSAMLNIVNGLEKKKTISRMEKLEDVIDRANTLGITGRAVSVGALQRGNSLRKVSSDLNDEASKMKKTSSLKKVWSHFHPHKISSQWFFAQTYM